MGDALSQVRTRNTATSQREQVLGRTDQVENHAGGYVFEVSSVDRLKRFLTLGTDGGTYYQKEQSYTRENAAFVLKFAKDNGTGLAYLLLDVSEQGRAPRQNPILFALAAIFAEGDAEAKKSAREVFTRIVRTGTHLFTFVRYAENLRGWGPSLTKAVSSWYLSKDPLALSYQLTKYRQREGFTHRDVLRLAHPKTSDDEKNALLRWAVGKDAPYVGWVLAFESAQAMGRDTAVTGKGWGSYVRSHKGIAWEMLPDSATSHAEVWDAMLDAGMPSTALLRNLPKLTRLGLSKGPALSKITTQLTDPERLRYGRVHPVQVLYALKTYAQGHGVQGRSAWTPSQAIVDALDAAFYLSFGTVEAAGKRTMLALDCSDSMTWASNMCGVLQAREGAVAMAMATAASEPSALVTGFCSSSGSYQPWQSKGTDGISELAISPRRRMDDNLATIRNTWAGGTDCSLPMRWALKNNVEIDTFAIYTDNETWAGREHPFESLRKYRQRTGINAKVVVVGMSSTGFTIADPSDKGMLDVAGFDAATPQVITGFSRGDFGG